MCTRRHYQGPCGHLWCYGLHHCPRVQESRAEEDCGRFILNVYYSVSYCPQPTRCPWGSKRHNGDLWNCCQCWETRIAQYWCPNCMHPCCRACTAEPAGTRVPSLLYPSATHLRVAEWSNPPNSRDVRGRNIVYSSDTRLCQGRQANGRRAVNGLPFSEQETKKSMRVSVSTFIISQNRRDCLSVLEIPSPATMCTLRAHYGQCGHLKYLGYNYCRRARRGQWPYSPCKPSRQLQEVPEGDGSCPTPKLCPWGRMGTRICCQCGKVVETYSCSCGADCCTNCRKA
ncbi:hypothetical protein VTK73DRAFT_7740 [Phialemonium thermophilum]|uniref:RanBP2-type domain-containing protein n=1 Tax=Phialemonium thermophilum TaxID=223376 RepID=A0ABR3WCQ1_9PEZI